MSATSILSEKSTNSLGDFEEQYIEDPAAVTILNEWVIGAIFASHNGSCSFIDWRKSEVHHGQYEFVRLLESITKTYAAKMV